MEDKYEGFVQAMCADIKRGVSRFLPGEPQCEGTTIATLFFGGGTPSVLSPEQIARILAAVKERYHLIEGAEISMEANPGTISLVNFKGYREAGVNRLSMGVQVLDDAMLRKLGRIHTASGALEAYALAREAGFTNVNLDFIYGLPNQDVSHLDTMLDRLLALRPLPEHLSLYSLIVEENTPLYTGVMRGLIKVPDDDTVADMYELVEQRLQKSGYSQYEISNWSRGLPCRHNLIYWNDHRYIAYGPGASGYWGTTRYKVISGPKQYVERAAAGKSVVQEAWQVGFTEEMGEFMMVGLRLNEGVSYLDFASRFGLDLEDAYGPELEKTRGLGLIREESDRVQLTPRGRLLGNEVFAIFLR